MTFTDEERRIIVECLRANLPLIHERLAERIGEFLDNARLDASYLLKKSSGGETETENKT